jgi:hypothetical protein
VIGDDGGAPLHLSMLQAGLHEDLSAEEEYNSCCATANPFAVQKAQFPNVKTMTLAYNTESLCEGNNNNWMTTNPTTGVDIIGFWDLDNYGSWIGPLMDASWLQNAETFASTGVKSFCTLPVSRIDPAYWTWKTQTTNFSVKVDDMFYTTPTTHTIASCDWQVLSGAKAVNGPNDPSVQVTLPWTARPCNGTITITVGASGYCNVNGAKTCLVFTRNHTTTGVVGNMTYQEYSINY